MLENLESNQRKHNMLLVETFEWKIIEYCQLSLTHRKILLKQIIHPAVWRTGTGYMRGIRILIINSIMNPWFNLDDLNWLSRGLIVHTLSTIPSFRYNDFVRELKEECTEQWNPHLRVWLEGGREPWGCPEAEVSILVANAILTMPVAYLCDWRSGRALHLHTFTYQHFAGSILCLMGFQQDDKSGHWLMNNYRYGHCVTCSCMCGCTYSTEYSACMWLVEKKSRKLVQTTWIYRRCCW